MNKEIKIKNQVLPNEQPVDEKRNQRKQQQYDIIAKPKVTKSKLLPNVFITAGKKIVKSENEAKKQKSHIKTEQQNMVNVKQKSETEHQSQDRKTKSKNPLIPIKNSIKIFQKFEQEMSEAKQMFEKFAKYKFPVHKTNSIKLEECITLSFVKTLKNHGCIKKILHVASFKIFYLEEQPINLKDDKQVIKQWLQNWEKCSNNEFMLKNFDLHWNNPVGFLSLIYEYPDYSSLENLLEIINNFPENVLRQICKEIIYGINFLAANNILYKHIQQSQFYIGNNNQIKFYPNLELNTKIANEENSNLLQLLQHPMNQKSSQIENIVFRLGLMFFRLALGKLVFQQQLNETIAALNNKELMKFKKSNINCCILHQLQTYENSLPLYKEIKSKWSRQFIDFLCSTLRYHYKQRIQLQQLKNEEFLKQIDPIFKNDFKDFIRLISIDNEHQGETTNVGKNKMQKIYEGIQMILGNSELQVNISALNIKSQLTLRCLEQQTGCKKQQILTALKKIYSKFSLK